MRVLIIIVLAVISGFLYRLGGAAKKGNWIDILRHTKTRDFGCPIVSFIALIVAGYIAPWYIHVLSMVALFGALTTYWDEVFGYDNFYAHGLGCGLAYIPYIFSGMLWFVVIRSVVLCIFMGLWCRIFSNDKVEEGGRGASLVLSVLL